MSAGKEQRPQIPPGARWRGKRIQVRVYRGYDADTGQSLYATKTAKDVTEAWKVWATLTQQVENQTYVAETRTTVEEHLKEWLDKAEVKPRTAEGYETIARLHINPHIGKVRLTRLTPKHVDDLMSKLAGTMSDSTRLNVFRVLHRALNVAVRWERVGRNVCDAVEPPSPPEPEMYIMTGAETDRILAAVKGDRLFPFYLTAVYTGMRQGELLALRWQDVNTDEGIAWVRQTLQTPGNNPVFGTPKNNRSRAVPLAENVIEALKSLRIDQEIERAHYAQDYRDYGLVFCQPHGGPIDGRSFNRWHWKSTKKAAEVPGEIRFHDLRHTFVSRALAAGANPRAVSDIVGHHDPGFTLRRYAHSLPNDREEAVRRLGEYLSRTAVMNPEA